MKFAHISDLHLGKRLNNFSMLEEQKYILEQILEIVEKENVSGVLIAGDVYDKAVPAAEAVSLFDDFLVQLAAGKRQVFVISGNHDSPERIAFASRLIASSGVYLSPVYNGSVKPVSVQDEYGDINIYMLPFVKPIHVRHFYPEETIDSYTSAIRCAIDHMSIDQTKRNIILVHQFVTGASRSDSEDISVGGLDNVDADVFDDFDYVALGHIHRPQNMGSERIRYAGTPLKYSFSEVNQKKSVTIVELKEKNDLSVYPVPLKPLHDLIEVRGTFDEVMDARFYRGMDTEAYICLTLLDERDVPNAFHKLRTVYPNLMSLDYEYRKFREQGKIRAAAREKKVDPLDLFTEFYLAMNNRPMTKEQETYLKEKAESIWSTDGRGQ